MPAFITHGTPNSVLAVSGAKYHDWRFKQLTNLSNFGKILSYGLDKNEHSIFTKRRHHIPSQPSSTRLPHSFTSLPRPYSYLATGFEQPEAATHGRQVAHVRRAQRGCGGHAPAPAAAAGGGLARSRWAGEAGPRPPRVQEAVLHHHLHYHGGDGAGCGSGGGAREGRDGCCCRRFLWRRRRWRWRRWTQRPHTDAPTRRPARPPRRAGFPRGLPQRPTDRGSARALQPVNLSEFLQPRSSDSSRLRHSASLCRARTQKEALCERDLGLCGALRPPQASQQSQDKTLGSFTPTPGCPIVLPPGQGLRLGANFQPCPSLSPVTAVRSQPHTSFIKKYRSDSCNGSGHLVQNLSEMFSIASITYGNSGDGLGCHCQFSNQLQMK